MGLWIIYKHMISKSKYILFFKQMLEKKWLYSILLRWSYSKYYKLYDTLLLGTYRGSKSKAFYNFNNK